MSAKILIINDSTADLMLLKSMLSDYSVLTACNKAEALHNLSTYEDIDLLILDTSLTKQDRCEILAALKKDPLYNHLRSIILTNANKGESEEPVSVQSAVDYMRIPFHREMLLARINLNLELSNHEKSKHELHESINLFDTIFQQLPFGIIIYHGDLSHADGNAESIDINPMFEIIAGRSKEEIIQLGCSAITHPDDQEEDLFNYKRFQSGEIDSYSMEKRYIRPDGSIIWVHMVVTSLLLPNQSKKSHICIVQDISKRKEIENALSESECSKSVLLSHLSGMAYRCNNDRKRTMLYVSSGCYELTGYQAESLVNNKELSYNDLIIPEHRETFFKEWDRVLSEKIPFQYEYQIITAKGERKWVLETRQGIYDEEGNLDALEGIILDISDRKETEENLRFQYEHDRWTGLHNRGYLENLLLNDAKIPVAYKRALISINLSSVQALTTTYGFHYTQDLIKNISNALQVYCTDKKLLFSAYDNRFVFYVKDYKNKDELIGFCETVAKTLDSQLMLERVGAGLGVIEVDKYRLLGVDELLKNLLIASGKALSTLNDDIGILFFDESMEAQIIRENEIKRELTQIATSNEDYGLFLQYQPILDLKTNRISGFEALARLNNDKLGLVPPLEFIPILEKTKLIIPIGRKIIRQALNFLCTLTENGFSTISISINVSAIQLTDSDFCQSLFEMINETHSDPRNICLEITESVFASNYDEINAILGLLVKSGIHIAIDDFGTGYSSLAREREMNVNCLKIDKFFINKLMLIDQEKAITGDIISMAHKLGHYAIAEGVEHDKQMQYLHRFGCDKVQGYLISRPLSEKSAVNLLRKSRSYAGQPD